MSSDPTFTTQLPVPEAIIEAVLAAVVFDDRGLVPAVAQQHDTGEVLMLAWMDRAAVAETLRTGRSCYWSRSRKALWRKGETSAQTQRVVEFCLDCDSDTILLKVAQTGVVCHTGRRVCFFRSLRPDGFVETHPVAVDPKTLYGG
ncbi:MAG: phosphoribosyl-AMP cyclohydrolase [Alphaproteobacteria bacterium]|nr:phosphoribosyl-AMP cyclohydrolase [Alphaproteobacteria bacterium]